MFKLYQGFASHCRCPLIIFGFCLSWNGHCHHMILLSKFKAPKRFVMSCQHGHYIFPDLFSRRFREGISFPNFVERSILEPPLSKLCGVLGCALLSVVCWAVPFALQKRAVFEGEKRARKCRENERKRGGQQRGQKGKKDA